MYLRIDNNRAISESTSAISNPNKRCILLIHPGRCRPSDRDGNDIMSWHGILGRQGKGERLLKALSPKRMSMVNWCTFFLN